MKNEISESDLGGTMRLRCADLSFQAAIRLAAKIYGSEEIIERHRHRYEVNNHYVAAIRSKQVLIVSGRSEEDKLVEMIELPDHPWFIGCQFHPEFTSTHGMAIHLFIGFIEAAKKHKTDNKTRK